jgi:hypothetical protein
MDNRNPSYETAASEASEPAPAHLPDIFIPAGQSSSLLEIKKSKFIGICRPAATEKEARAIVLTAEK